MYTYHKTNIKIINSLYINSRKFHQLDLLIQPFLSQWYSKSSSIKAYLSSKELVITFLLFTANIELNISFSKNGRLSSISFTLFNSIWEKDFQSLTHFIFFIEINHSNAHWYIKLVRSDTSTLQLYSSHASAGFKSLGGKYWVTIRYLFLNSFGNLAGFSFLWCFKYLMAKNATTQTVKNTTTFTHSHDSIRYSIILNIKTITIIYTIHDESISSRLFFFLNHILNHENKIRNSIIPRVSKKCKKYERNYVIQDQQKIWIKICI